MRGINTAFLWHHFLFVYLQFPTGKDTMTPLFTDLPQELLDAVIDLFFDDRGYLTSCSLVCKCLRHRSQKHIFKAVSLMIAGHNGFPRQLALDRGILTSMNIDKLWEILRVNRPIAGYIFDIHLCSQEIICTEPHNTRFFSILGFIKANRTDPQLPLGKLSITNTYTTQPCFTPHRSMAASFRNITSLELREVEKFPTFVITSCPNIKRLLLDHAELVGYPVMARLELSELVIGHTKMSTIRFLVDSLVDLTQLQRLCFASSDGLEGFETERLDYILPSCAHRLKEIEIHLSRFSSRLDTFDLRLTNIWSYSQTPASAALIPPHISLIWALRLTSRNSHCMSTPGTIARCIMHVPRPLYTIP